VRELQREKVSLEASKAKVDWEVSDMRAKREREEQAAEERRQAQASEMERQLKHMRVRHQEDLTRVRMDYDMSLAQIKQLHEKDKALLEGMLKKCEERLRKGDSEQTSNLLEVENRYLRDIRNLNDSFDAYKKQVEKRMQQLAGEKQTEVKRTEDAEALVLKLKQSIRVS